MNTKLDGKRQLPTQALAIAWLLCLLVPVPAIAANFSLNPTRVELDSGHRTAVVTMRNAGSSPLRMQARPMLWTIQPDGAWQLTPSDDLIVTPELIEIAPGVSKQFRVGTLADAGDHEISYRLLLDELPNLGADDAPKAAQVKVLTQISLPIFLEPADAAPIPSLRSAEVDRGALVANIGNTGTRRLDPQGVKVTISDHAGKVIDRRDAMINYVLPGSSWPLHLMLTTRTCARAASIAIVWPGIDDKAISHPITSGSQACEGTDSH